MIETAKIKDVKQLLQNVAAIKNKYDEINRLTGADYNVFNVLKLRSDEVRLHSRFIGDLLNPKGKHGRGDVFLKLFLEQIQANLNGSWEKDFYSKNAKVYIEKSIGSINEDKTEGGQIDLVIEDCNNKRIIIENKIYASDQYNQLLRYHNYDSKALIIYLTLDGKEASQISITSKEDKKNDERVVLKTDVDYFRMSYKENIICWLESGIQETTNYPFLRESINQYLNIVKQLTGQSINKDMDKEVIKSVSSSKDSYDAALLIKRNFLNGQKKILRNFRDKIEEQLEKQLKELEIVYKIKTIEKDSNKEFPNEVRTIVLFENKDMVSDNDFVFEISRMVKKEKINRDFYYGFRFNNVKNHTIDKSFSRLLISCTNLTYLKGNSAKFKTRKKYWVAMSYEENYLSDSFISNLVEKETCNNNVEFVVDKMIDAIKGYCDNKSTIDEKVEEIKKINKDN